MCGSTVTVEDSIHTVIQIQREGKEYLNMSESLRDLSNKIGFEIEVSSICTICDSSYNSYRENKTSKRQYGFIWQ